MLSLELTLPRIHYKKDSRACQGLYVVDRTNTTKMIAKQFKIIIFIAKHPMFVTFVTSRGLNSLFYLHNRYKNDSGFSEICYENTLFDLLSFL